MPHPSITQLAYLAMMHSQTNSIEQCVVINMLSLAETLRKCYCCLPFFHVGSTTGLMPECGINHDNGMVVA